MNLFKVSAVLFGDMSNEHSIQSKILVQSAELFKQFSIRSISMDDIARKLGVSKKTLYLHFDNKADLIQKAIEHHLQEECEAVKHIYEDAENAIDEMVNIGEYVSRQLRTLHTAAIYDLKKYYRNSFELIRKHRTEFVYSVIIRNIQDGIKQGLYRKNIQPEVVATFYISSVREFLEDGFLHQTGSSINEVYSELLKYHIYGIASEKGITYLKEHILKKKNKNHV